MRLKQDCILTLVSLFQNIRVGIWGERGEQWSFAIMSLVAFIVNGKLPLLWLVKILGFGLLFSGAGLFSSGLLELGECIRQRGVSGSIQQVWMSERVTTEM